MASLIGSGGARFCMPMMTPIRVLGSILMESPKIRLDSSCAKYWASTLCMLSVGSSPYDCIDVPHRIQNRACAESIMRHLGHWIRFLLSKVILSSKLGRRLWLPGSLKSRLGSVGSECETLCGLECAIPCRRTTAAPVPESIDKMRKALSVAS